ncbi:nitrite reductase [Desulfovibrio sp. Huiquan2017]|uniref:nitrite reductase n=1 Tax=Desulfovibrio sp. Huiquan2017 TaxID=2816861 RepID=UPI001A919897|nr:nitrite reductase [Desulfovibrio sp. Huiquan2017]
MNMEEYIKGLPKGAVRARRDGTYTVVPRMRLGQMDAELLEAVSRAVRENGLAGVRLAASQRLMIDNVPASALRAVVTAVGLVGDAYAHKVQGCQGAAGCKLGQQDSLAAADRLERMLVDFSLPAKLKTGVSGCPMCCAESLVRDVGLFGRKHGWTVSFGGNGGKRVRGGDILAENVSEEEAFYIIRRALVFYAEHGKVKERTARFVERVGLDAVRLAVFSEPQA